MYFLLATITVVSPDMNRRLVLRAGWPSKTTVIRPPFRFERSQKPAGSTRVHENSLSCARQEADD